MKKHRPNLIIMHLITPDGFEHDYGPHCEEAYWACRNADTRIGELWDALQQPGLKEKSTLFVVSDHGFSEIYQAISPNVALRKMGLITLDEKNNKKFKTRKAWSHSNGGAAGIYILDEDNKDAIRKQLLAELPKLEGIDRVMDVKDFMKYGLPDPMKNPEQPDIMLAAKEGYSFSNKHTGSEAVSLKSKIRRGTHGHRPDQRFMHATLIAAGAGIKAGGKIKIASCLDVAPTAAKLLGIKMPTAEGRVMTEFLER